MSELGRNRRWCVQRQVVEHKSTPFFVPGASPRSALRMMVGLIRRPPERRRSRCSTPCGSSRPRSREYLHLVHDGLRDSGRVRGLAQVHEHGGNSLPTKRKRKSLGERQHRMHRPVFSRSRRRWPYPRSRSPSRGCRWRCTAPPRASLSARLAPSRCPG